MRIYWTIPRIVPKFSIKFQQKRSFIDEIDYFFALETYIVTECRHIIDHFEHRKKKNEINLKEHIAEQEWWALRMEHLKIT